MLTDHAYTVSLFFTGTFTLWVGRLEGRLACKKWHFGDSLAGGFMDRRSLTDADRSTEKNERLKRNRERCAHSVRTFTFERHSSCCDTSLYRAPKAPDYNDGETSSLESTTISDRGRIEIVGTSIHTLQVGLLQRSAGRNSWHPCRWNGFNQSRMLRLG